MWVSWGQLVCATLLSGGAALRASLAACQDDSHLLKEYLPSTHYVLSIV